MKTNNSLLTLRKKIDRIDKNIATLLKQRFELVSQIKSEKVRNNLPIVDKQREEEVLNKMSLPIRTVYKTILSVSKRLQL